MSSTLQASVFMGKNYSDNLHSIKYTEDLTMKQMFDISEKLITEQSDEIYGMSTINWERSSWKHLSLVGDEEVISLLHTKVHVFSDSVLCPGKVNENPQSNIAWEDRLRWFKGSAEDRTLDRIDGEPMEFERNIFPRFTTLQLWNKVQGFLSKLSVTPEKFTGRIIFMSMFNDTSWGFKDNKKECESNVQFVSLCAKRFGAGRVHYPEECLRAKDMENCQYTIALTRERLKLFFAQLFPSISSVFTEPCQRCAKNVTPAMIEQGDLLWQDNLNPLFVPSVMKTHIPLTDDPAHKDFLLQRYQERIEKLSQQDRVIKFCTDAGFLTTVEVGQYFMTKDTEEFSQFTDSVACREYTLPRDESLTEPKGWIRGNTKIGPVLEVTTCCLQGKKEWKSEFSL